MAKFGEFETTLKNGGQETPVIVGTSPATQNANSPIIKDIYDIAKKEESEGVETKDIYADNVFVKDEFEFDDLSGDFGSNAKGKIRSAVATGQIGMSVSQSNFLQNSHVDITIGDFSAYKFGSLMIVHLKYTTESLAPSEKLFDIKTSYKPKKETIKGFCQSNGTLVSAKFETSGAVTNLTTISSTPAVSVYIDIIYELASY